MKLHLDRQLFRQAVQFTSDQMKMLPIYIEKDYWVTFALHAIFHNVIGNDTVFKGGTALSKCYNIIERFSEDIDLVVLRREGETNNKLTNKIKKISEVVSEALPEINIEGLTHKMGMNRKTVHSFNKEFQGTYGQIRDVIVIEATWLGYYEPFSTRSISSFVGNMMVSNGQTSIAEQNGLLPFEIRVLEPSRTLCEKIMSLVRFSYSENALEDLNKKIRHTYDLHQLLQMKEVKDFLNSPSFDEMLLKVANDDIVSFKNNNRWLGNHPANALVFNELDLVWDGLKSTYNNNFKYLVYGSLPNEKDIFNSLKTIKERLTRIPWPIKIEYPE